MTLTGKIDPEAEVHGVRFRVVAAGPQARPAVAAAVACRKGVCAIHDVEGAGATLVAAAERRADISDDAGRSSSTLALGSGRAE